MIQKEDASSVTDGANLQLYKQEDELLPEVKFSFLKESKKSIIVLESKDTQATAHLDGASLKQTFTIIKASIPFFLGESRKISSHSLKSCIIHLLF